MLEIKSNLRKMAMIVACLAVIIMFAACDNKKDDDDENGNPAVTADDAISVKALAGTWWSRGWSELFYWSFGEDGNFAYYVPTISPNVGYWNEFFIKGKYRVKGNVIECYNCQCDYYSGDYIGDNKYFGVSERSNLPDNILLETKLKDPQKIDNFSMLFEFFDAMRMRIVLDLSVIHNIEHGDMHTYDADFNYNSNNHNVEVPTHTIPGLAWPKNNTLIPAGTPEFSNGRIRAIDNTTFDYEIRIDIDRTTRAALMDYIDSLVQFGWIRTGTTQTETIWIFYLEMGEYTLTIESENDYSFRLIFY